MDILSPGRPRVDTLTPSQRRGLLSLFPDPGTVLLEEDALEPFSKDESPATPSRPAAVVFPSSPEAVSELLAFASRENLPVTPRGAGSGKVGGAIPASGGLVLSLERMNRVLELDEHNRLIEVEPGVITGTLRQAVAEKGLFYPPDPNSLELCTLGGNVASNASGPSSMKYGATRAHVLGLEVVLMDGSPLRLGRRTTKSSTGYDLTDLFVGSEGTLGVVTGITLRLLIHPPASRTLFSFFSSTRSAIAGLTDLQRAGLSLRAAEFFDHRSLLTMTDRLSVPPTSKAGLLFQLDGSEASLDESLEKLMSVLGSRAHETVVATDSAMERRLWDARHDTSKRVKAGFALRRSEDVAVPPANLPQMVEALEALKESSGITIVAYGHAGDGNLHVNLLFDSPEEAPRVEAVTQALFKKALELGGTLSGEHGIGLTKRQYMPLEQGETLLSLQRRLKSVFDPKHLLNPGKVFP